MPNRVSEEARIAAEAYAEIQKQARALAATLGPATGTSNVVGEEEVRRWNEMDPQYAGVDANQLVAQGMSPAEATLRKYPHRGAMLESGKLLPEEQYRYAVEMERRSQAYRQKQAERANVAMQDGTLDVLNRIPGFFEGTDGLQEGSLTALSNMPSTPEVPMAAPVPGPEQMNGGY